ncbi:MAG TPA: protein kinase [Vicinamibacterales bacterium]|nr:protein kinase [Vicinamibacterales bacterium]
MNVPSQRIGRYEIRGQLGAGGMGEVYRAWDPDLQREVALKRLPEHTVHDQERRRRLLDEARAVGALAHANVVAVYDVDVTQEVPFVVTELIDGKRLRDEIDAGAVPTRRLLDLAVQIAAGLSAAHARGITHRDLKPENVMITRDGRVKLVDFGLARVVTPPSTDAATLSVAVTVSSISGTPGYMSPEQARGAERIDFYSDQFSFGLILYEMATGTHPFRRDSAVETMSAIVSDEADPIARVNPKVPAPLRWIIERCLSKEPVDRYASTTDLLKDLATLQSRLSEITAEGVRPIAVQASSGRRYGLPIAAALALLAGAASFGFGAGEAPVQNWVPLVADTSFQTAPAWSPDGKRLAYVSEVDGVLEVFTKGTESSTSKPTSLTIRRRVDSNDPFWSAVDGSRVYFHSKAGTFESLWSVGAVGGDPELVVENATRSAMSRDGHSLVFFREERPETPNTFGLQRSLFFASVANNVIGAPRRYMEPPFDKRTFVEGFFRFSPDGSKVLAWVWGWPDLASARPVPVSEFWILPWPAGSGKPYRVMQSLEQAAPAPVSFDWLSDSRHIVLSLWDRTGLKMHLWEADTAGTDSRQLTVTPQGESLPTVTRDGKRLAFASGSINFNLVEIPLDGGPAREILATSLNEVDPSFTPDGSRYAFQSDYDGTLRIQTSTSDDSFRRTVVDADEFKDRTLALGSLALSPDGGRIAYQRYSAETGYQVLYGSTSGGTPHVPISQGSLYQDGPSWSPEGDRLAFTERTKGNEFVIAVKQVGTDQPPRVVVRGPVRITSKVKWSRDGLWILFENDEGLAIVQPDGSGLRQISRDDWIEYEWAADSRSVYGLRESDDRYGHFMLAQIDIKAGTEEPERIINPDLGLIPLALQPIRGLTLTPKRLVTSVAEAPSAIYSLENFARERSWFSWLRRR